MVEKGELGCGAEIPKFLEQGGTGKVYAQGTSGNEQPISASRVLVPPTGTPADARMILQLTSM